MRKNFVASLCKDVTKIVQESPIWSLLSFSLVQISLLRFKQLSNVCRMKVPKSLQKSYEKETHISLLWSSKFGILDQLKIPPVSWVVLKKLFQQGKNRDWNLCMTTGNPREDDLFVDVRNQYFTVLENCASILPRGGEQSAWQHYLGIPELIFLELNETAAH